MCRNRQRANRDRAVPLIAALGLLGLTGCAVPNDLWVNIISSGALTVSNVLVSALANRTAEQLFGTTGSAGSGVDLGGDEAGGHGHDE